jgi:hypothetical protein
VKALPRPEELPFEVIAMARFAGQTPGGMTEKKQQRIMDSVAATIQVQ